MNDLKNYLVQDHKECDGLFSKLENAIYKSDINSAKAYFYDFYRRTKRHFYIEEEILFPEFERITASTMGPTQVMRMEHQDINFQLDEINKLMEQEKIEEKEIAQIQSILENILFILQQHNLKEEQILYNMMEKFFQETQKNELLNKIKNLEYEF